MTLVLLVFIVPGLFIWNTLFNEEKNVTALFNLAVIYEEKGERAKAKETY